QKKTGITFEIYPLKHADATSVANTLTQVFTRVQTGPGATTLNRPNFNQNPVGALLQQQLQQSSVLLIPLPRYNAIMIGVAANRMPTIKAEIDKLDKAPTADATATPFPLKKASASQVANQI